VKRFVSEPIIPVGGELDSAALARAEPSLPGAFRWRDREVRIAGVLLASRDVREESFSGERYLRRHVWKLRMEDGARWEVYFVRSAPAPSPRRGGRARWFLKTIEEPEE
jgi:hypothetical protein